MPLRAFFVHGFAKNEKENISGEELAAFRMLAAQLLTYHDDALERATANGTLMEIEGR